MLPSSALLSPRAAAVVLATSERWSGVRFVMRALALRRPSSRRNVTTDARQCANGARPSNGKRYTVRRRHLVYTQQSAFELSRKRQARARALWVSEAINQ